MKRLLVMLVSAIVSLVITSIVQAAPTESTGDIGSSDVTREPRAAWAAALESKNSVIPKFGSYALSAHRQDLKMYGDEGCILFCIFGTGFAVHSFPIEMQSSSAVAGLEYERKTPWGYSLGGEFLHTEPRYTASLIDPHTGAFTTRADGQMRINQLFVMIKNTLPYPKASKFSEPQVAATPRPACRVQSTNEPAALRCSWRPGCSIEWIESV